MNLLNPKVSLFFLALLPQFVDKASGHVSIQMALLGVLFLVQALMVFTVVSVFSEKLRQLLLNNSFIAGKVNKIKGVILGVIGLQIAFSNK